MLTIKPSTFVIEFNLINDLYKVGEALTTISQEISQEHAEAAKNEDVLVDGILISLSEIDIETKDGSIKRPIFVIYVESINRICAIFPRHQIKSTSNDII